MQPPRESHPTSFFWQNMCVSPSCPAKTGFENASAANNSAFPPRGRRGLGIRRTVETGLRKPQKRSRATVNRREMLKDQPENYVILLSPNNIDPDSPSGIGEVRPKFTFTIGVSLPHDCALGRAFANLAWHLKFPTTSLFSWRRRHNMIDAFHLSMHIDSIHRPGSDIPLSQFRPAEKHARLPGPRKSRKPGSAPASRPASARRTALKAYTHSLRIPR